VANIKAPTFEKMKLIFFITCLSYQSQKNDFEDSSASSVSWSFLHESPY